MRREQIEQLPLVFRGRDAVAAGVLTPSDLRGPRCERLFQGIYTVRGVEITHALRCEAAGLLLPVKAMITGASAATVLGLGWNRALDDVEVVVPEGPCRPGARGVTLRRSWTPLEQGRAWRTTRLATPERMAFDAAARVPLPLAVARLDALARRGLVTPEGFGTWLEGRNDNDVCRVRQAAALVDARAESVPESQVRVLLHLADIETEPQHLVRSAGRAVARVDLAVPAARLAIEYDGAWHALREELEKDRERLNRLHAAGWVVVHVTAALLADPAALVDVVRRALLRCSTTTHEAR